MQAGAVGASSCNMSSPNNRLLFSPVVMVWSRDPCSLVALETVRCRIFYDLMTKLGRVWDGLNKLVFDRLLNKRS